MNLIPVKLQPRPLRRKQDFPCGSGYCPPGCVLSRGDEQQQTRAQPLELILGLLPPLQPLDSYGAVNSQRGVQEEGVLHTGLRPAGL